VMVRHIEILVEEPSMEAALRILLPRMVGDLSFNVYPYECKQDLLGKLPGRLRGYASWLPQDWRILVVVDRDNEHCADLKRQLETMAGQAGLKTRIQRRGPDFQVVNRLAIEELEAWFFGDWPAVLAAYPRVDAHTPAKEKYRNPDAITGGTWEALEKVLQRSGYFRTGLRKIEAARAIAEHMDPHRNQSTSFRKLREVLGEMAADSRKGSASQGAP
jgi:hypothetical protein